MNKNILYSGVVLLACIAAGAIGMGIGEIPVKMICIAAVAFLGSACVMIAGEDE